MMSYLLLQKIILSVAIGALIGLERERRAKGKDIFAGIRTFMLVSLLGLLSSYASQFLGNFLPVVISLAGVVGLAIASYFVKYSRSKKVGMTSEFAFILAFFIGFIVFFEEYPYILSVSLGIMITLILLLKETLHKFAHHLTRKELFDAMIFAIIAFVILPLLPSEAIDPFGALNPRRIWFAMVSILSVSFLAYIAMKIFGVRKGVALTGFLGGFASSTGVTISMGEKYRRNKKILYSATFAVVAASSTMFFRQIMFTFFFNPNLSLYVLFPLFLIGSGGFLISYVFWKKSFKEKRTTAEIGSPLALKPAVLITLYIAFIMLVANLTERYFGLIGIYAISLLAGLADVDAMTITLSVFAFDKLPPLVSVIGIILVGLSNTVSKLFIIRFIGGSKISKEVLKGFSVILLVGLVVLFLLLNLPVFPRP
jgi:uncharacterized membrane protein (DUF4010 family)